MANQPAPSNPAKDPEGDCSRHQALLSELAALRRKVDELTRSGHDLINTQTKLQALLHNVSDAIVQFEQDGTVKAFNRTAEKVFGRAEIEMLYKRIDHLFELPGDFHNRLIAYLTHYCDNTPDQYQRPLVVDNAAGEHDLQAVVGEVLGELEALALEAFRASQQSQGRCQGYGSWTCHRPGDRRRAWRPDSLPQQRRRRRRFLVCAALRPAYFRLVRHAVGRQIKILILAPIAGDNSRTSTDRQACLRQTCTEKPSSY